ncbi:MAG: proline dehydrogenase family protein [Actinomycetota bacterium]|nr:proline dehydrogenase family protein [Actinomycetota bacterium]
MPHAPLARRLLFAAATSERWEQFVRSLPLGERVAYHVASRYVAGRQFADALACADRLAGDGLLCSLDLFGESVVDPLSADQVASRYVELTHGLEQAPNAFLSIDLSHIGLDEAGDGARRRLERIAAGLPAGRRLQVGAEQERRADRILSTVLAVAGIGGSVSATVQANLKRSRSDAFALAEAGVPVRLVKGAYLEDPHLTWAWGEPTDLAFLELAHELHSHGAEVSLATHDPILREALLRALPRVGIEMLLGVRSEDAARLAHRGVPVRIYVPFGDQWFRYAMRRWAESQSR